MTKKTPRKNREEPEGIRPCSYRKNRIEEQRIKELLEEEEDVDDDYRQQKDDGG